jgi:hypothetical protein
MTETACESDAFRAIRARSELVRAVRDQLKGTGLDIRELVNELVLSNPGHPEQGRIYVTYDKAEVSHRRTLWDYLGYLNGHGNRDDEIESGVSAEKIIGILTGQNSDSL